MRRLRDWAVTIPMLVVFGITLVVFDLAGRIALLFGRRAFEWTMAGLQWSLLRVFGIAGVRVVVEGADRLEPGRPYLMISNHQSMFDIPLFGGILVRHFPKYVAKKELGRGIPSVSLNLQRGGNALIDRKDSAQALGAIRTLAGETVERGTAIVIFPEGTRSRDGTLGRFKVGGVAAVLEAVPTLSIVPVAVDGAWKVFRNNLLPVPWGTTVRVRFGEAFSAEGMTPEEVVAAAREWIAATLAGWRGEAAAFG